MIYIPPRPLIEDRELWQRYWQALGQGWRIEQEISRERQKYLASLRDAELHEQQNIYPFQNVELRRGDIEWLLVRENVTDKPTLRSPFVMNDPLLPDFEVDFNQSEDEDGQSYPSLYTHDDVEDKYKYECIKLDIRGAILSRVDLHDLPPVGHLPCEMGMCDAEEKRQEGARSCHVQHRSP